MLFTCVDKISVSTFPKLIEELWDVRVKWCLFGTALGVRTPDLDAIKRKHRGDPDECFRELLSEWINNDIPTWAAVLDALRNRTVDENRLAETIQQKLEGASIPQSMNSKINIIHYIV